MNHKKVLLLGSYGQSNLGDDLLMWNFLELLKSKGFDEIYVNANTTDYIPKPINEAYPDLQCINTYETPITQYVRLIRDVDCIVYGGGTLYKELYSSTGRSKYSVIVRMMAFNVLARILGTKLFHLNIGIGSLKTGLGRLISKIAITSSTMTVFRDRKSYNYARLTLRVPANKIMKSTDGLFLNHTWEKPWHQAKLKVDRKKYKQVVGVNVLSDIPDWVDRDSYIKTMQEFVIQLLDQGNYVVFVPFQHAFNPRNDLWFTHEVFDTVLKDRTGYEILSEVPIDKASSCLQQCDVFVGMRFHSLLLATVNGVPFLAVAYDTKCWRFVQENDYPYAVELEKINVTDLMRIFDDMVATKKKSRKHLNGIAKEMYDEAEEGLRKLHL